MIEVFIDTSRLKEKLTNASRKITSAIEQGVSNGSEDLAKQIDDFMFVPLQFDPDVSKQSNETTAKIGVSLNLPPRSTTHHSKFHRYRRRKKVRASRRSWKDYVRQLGQDGSREMSDSVEVAIREGLR